MSKKQPLVNIIIPIHNEKPNLDWFLDELKDHLAKESSGCEFEYILIDDGSTDGSLNRIRQFTRANQNAYYMSFSKNFGKEAATSAGLQAARGDAAIMIDSDGQHPYRLIAKFIKEWQAGADVVVGVRSSNQKEGAIKKYGSKLFYRILNFLNDSEITPATTDFRLVDRKVLDEFNKLTERNRITRGLIDWLGFTQKFISFEAVARKHGKATYSNAKLLKLAINSFISHSTKPLKIIGALGLLVTVLSALTGIFILVEQLILGDPLGLSFTGTAMLAIFLSFLTGITLSCQGLLALYIETIHTEAQNRPLYVVSESNL